MTVKVKANQWAELKEALERYQSANMQLNELIARQAFYTSFQNSIDDEAEARSELCDAIERVVENAVEA